MTYVIGPGVQQAIADAGDEARSDEIAVVTDDEGWKITQTYARDGIYYWLREDNAVRRVPF